MKFDTANLAGKHPGSDLKEGLKLLDKHPSAHTYQATGKAFLLALIRKFQSIRDASQRRVNQRLLVVCRHQQSEALGALLAAIGGRW